MSPCPLLLAGKPCATCDADRAVRLDAALRAGHAVRPFAAGESPVVCSCGHGDGSWREHLDDVAAAQVAVEHGLPETAAPVLRALWRDGWHLDDALAAADATAPRARFDELVAEIEGRPGAEDRIRAAVERMTSHLDEDVTP